MAVSLPGGRCTGTTECEILAGRTNVVEVQLAPSLAFEGIVVDRRGLPAPGVVVRLENAAFGDSPPSWASFRVGPSGRFRVWAEALSDPVSAVLLRDHKMAVRTRLRAGNGNRVVIPR